MEIRDRVLLGAFVLGWFVALVPDPLARGWVLLTGTLALTLVLLRVLFTLFPLTTIAALLANLYDLEVDIDEVFASTAKGTEISKDEMANFLIHYEKEEKKEEDNMRGGKKWKPKEKDTKKSLSRN